MDFNRWWLASPEERYWLEITDRLDLGVDLNAPQLGRNGREQWHYSLIHEVNPGDVVFHYHREGAESAISAWSTAWGEVWEDEVVWAPHAGGHHEALLQPGWRLNLEGFHPLSRPVTFQDIRQAEDLIRVLESELEDTFGAPLYTPFETGQRAIRPKQAYLTKFPAELVEAFPPLRQAMARSTGGAPTQQAQPSSLLVGEQYRNVNEDVLVSEAEPFAKDPALVERGLRSHAATQNALARFVEGMG